MLSTRNQLKYTDSDRLRVEEKRYTMVTVTKIKMKQSFTCIQSIVENTKKCQE